MERWTRLFVSAAPDLLALMLDPVVMARTFLQFFIAEAPDPNCKRQLFVTRARRAQMRRLSDHGCTTLINLN
jgi:hypothetical protein